MIVSLLSYPTDSDWIEVKRRALITLYGRDLGDIKPPNPVWKSKILEARHSPIRYLRFSFLITDIPSNISVHLCRHVHAQPYVSSLRNDRQRVMDGDAARRDTPVDMILDVNAEELMVIANKRLCHKSAAKTQEVVKKMCVKVLEVAPEFQNLLVPACVYNGGVCHEMLSCKGSGENKL